MKEYKPILFYQADEENFPLFPFCFDAAKGAKENNIKIFPLKTSQLPKYNLSTNPNKIFVGSVEATQQILNKTIIPINDSWAFNYKKRNQDIIDIKNITTFPTFIKPYNQIKTFTGFVAMNKYELKQLSNNYQGKVIQQPIINFVAEYRVYVSKLIGILGIYQYLGEPYNKLDRTIIEKCTKESRQFLTEESYTLDFGITNKNETILIEVNDGWAIGNYGLNPSQYYHFVKNRFLQLKNGAK